MEQEGAYGDEVEEDPNGEYDQEEAEAHYMHEMMMMQQQREAGYAPQVDEVMDEGEEAG